MEKPVTTKCWCLTCEPKTGEIGLECKKKQTPMPDDLLHELARRMALAAGSFIPNDDSGKRAAAMRGLHGTLFNCLKSSPEFLDWCQSERDFHDRRKNSNDAY
jgi:hypothetical protein